MKACILLTCLFTGVLSAGGEPIRIGVAPVEHSWRVPSGVAATVQAELEGELARSARFELVERQHLKEVLEEVAFEGSGVTDPASATQLGHQLNAEMLLFVNVARLDSEYVVNSKVVVTATGRVARAHAEPLGMRDEGIPSAARRVARRLVAAALALVPVEMVLLPGGQFTMGSMRGLADERPVHEVRLDSFFLDRSEVSQAAYDAFLEARGSPPGPHENPDHPATAMSWSDAEGYCHQLAKRLPTEAEWEYAASGAAGRVYPWGDKPPNSQRARVGGSGTAPVDALPAGATPEGILNLAGNVAEWVADWWAPAYPATPLRDNPEGPGDGDYRVVRGGSWADLDTDLSNSARGYHDPGRGSVHIGFRCAQSARP